MSPIQLLPSHCPKCGHGPLPWRLYSKRKNDDRATFIKQQAVCVKCNHGIVLYEEG